MEGSTIWTRIYEDKRQQNLPPSGNKILYYGDLTCQNKQIFLKKENKVSSILKALSSQYNCVSAVIAKLFRERNDVYWQLMIVALIFVAGPKSKQISRASRRIIKK